MGGKEKKLIYAYRQSAPTELVAISKAEQERFCLDDEEAIQLGIVSIAIEKHYGHPMDIEWAKDGDGKMIGDGKLYVVQARSSTFRRDPLLVERTRIGGERGEVLVSGTAASPGTGQGRVKILESAHYMSEFRDGEILVTDMTDPDWVPVMRKAAAIVTNRGGKNCHAAIVAREFGTPCVVGTKNATELLRGIDTVTVNCGEGGEIGEVMRGLLPLVRSRLDLRLVHDLKEHISTKVMLILADPLSVPQYSFYPNDGIGLARIEFIIRNLIKVHPLLAIHPKPDEILNAEDLSVLSEYCVGYDTAREYFISRLSQGIMQLAAAVEPRSIIVRFSDFKTNEYARLLGGSHFEPREENPMLGWRGVSRYYDPRYRDAFQQLECEAIRRARDVHGFRNIIGMLPFVRTVKEARQVIQLMDDAGLRRGVNGFEVYCMVEIPANVVQLEALAEVFDGFSIGSNDLAQLTLGIDRDSENVAHIADERDPAVRWMIETAIKRARRLGKPIGICGQAPSNYPEFAQWLVSQLITSISVLPDAIPQTLINVYDAEKMRKMRS